MFCDNTPWGKQELEYGHIRSCGHECDMKSRHKRGVTVHHQLYHLLKKKKINSFAVCSSTDIIRSWALLLFCDFGFVGDCPFLPSLLITFLVLKSFSFPSFEQNFSVVVYAITLYKLDLKMHICIILARSVTVNLSAVLSLLISSTVMHACNVLELHNHGSTYV